MSIGTAEERLRGQLGSLEAERDRYRRAAELSAAEVAGLKRSLAAVSAERNQAQEQRDRLVWELAQERQEKAGFKVARVLGRGKDAVIEMEPVKHG